MFDCCISINESRTSVFWSAIAAWDSFSEANFCCNETFSFAACTCCWAIRTEAEACLACAIIVAISAGDGDDFQLKFLIH